MIGDQAAQHEEAIVVRVDRFETGRRLLDAAIECFLEKGYDETTVDQIADRADVARATVFNHFPEKARFLSAYLERRRALVRVLLRNEVAAGPTQCSVFVTR